MPLLGSKLTAKMIYPFNSIYQMLIWHWLPSQYQYEHALSCIAALLFWGLSVAK